MIFTVVIAFASTQKIQKNETPEESAVHISLANYKFQTEGHL
jgi:hypothetical protein